MRVAVLTNAFAPMPGGAAHVAGLHVRMLRDAGHEVEVFRPEIPWLKYPAPLRLFFHLHDLLSHREMTDKIIAWHPDVLLTHNLTGCGFGTAQAIRSTQHVARSISWIHVLHDVQLFEPSGALVDATAFTLWQKFWSNLRRRALKKPDLVISPTAWLLEQHTLRGLFLNIKSEILPNPAPPVSFAMRAASLEPKLFFLGHTKGKGGEVVDQIAKRISYPIHRIVSAPNEEVIEAMRNADILLFPSQVVENQPTVLLEAASLGLPVIASDVGGVRETLKGAGIVVPKDNIQAWIDAIEFLRDPSNYREHTSKMYELAKKHDPQEYARRFTALITEG